MTNKVSRIAIICALEETIRDEVKRMCDTDSLAELDTMALHAKENVKMLQSVKYASLVKERVEVVKDLVKTENSSEIPNNCEPKTDEFELFDREALILLIECQKERIAELLAKTEPQTDCDHRCKQTEVGCEQTDCAWMKGE